MSEFAKYKYKLNYIDFLKLMISSNVYDLEKYIFLQTEPIEIEVYFEEVLLSVNHESFKIGENMTNFMRRYYIETEKIVETLLEKGAEEFFKIQTMSNKEYVKGLILSYMDLLKKTDEIQNKLLSKMRKEYIPITITVNSYILNRVATSYEEQFTGKKILLSDVGDSSGVTETQIRDLHINMICMTPYKKELAELRKQMKTVKNSRIIENLDKPTISTKNKLYTADVVKCSELYNTILEQDCENQLNKWIKGQVAEVLLPYFNLQSRGLKSDWHYRKCQLPKNFKVN